MVRKQRVFKLSAQRPDGVRRFISDIVDATTLSESQTARWVTVTRTGTFHDPRYGEFDITHEMLLSMVRNFDADVYGQEIVIDLSHAPQQGAGGFVRKLQVEGDGKAYKLRALVEFTKYGIEAVKDRGFIYLSAEFADNYISNESPRKEHGYTLLGAALTPRPVIKRLDPVRLSEEFLDEKTPTYLSQKLAHDFIAKGKTEMKKLLAELKEKLIKLTLAEPVVMQLCDAFTSVATPMADEALQRALMENFVTTGKELSAQLSGTTGSSPVINLSMPAATGGMSADDVKKLMEDIAAEQKASAKTLAENLAANVKLFSDAIDAAEGLDEDVRKELAEAADLITAEMTPAQVTALTEQQLKLGHRMAAQAQLASQGFNSRGTVHISVDDSNSAKALQEEINKHLRGQNRQLVLAEPDKDHPFVAKVLAEFDRLNMSSIINARKVLAGGSTAIADTSLPVGVQRTVIREALSDMRVLELVQVRTDFSAQGTTQIPYETRDISGVLNDGVVYEGQPIHRASVSQAMDLAYILPMKVAFLISNEVMHFTRSSMIDWDAFARNVESNARVLRELIVRRICNELQRASDAYGAIAVTAEAFDAQVTGANSIIKTVNFPIVRPHQQYDMAGNAIGSVENPIAMVLNGVTITAYDGSNTQASGTYYRVTNYNLGYIQLVSELGVAVTPADTGVNTLGYSYATNIVKFDLDNGTTDIEKHNNGLLRAVGGRKAMMLNDRFITPDFLLMSHVLHDTVTNAEQFTQSASKSGTALGADGDLDRVKSIAAFGTNAPGVDLGDERIVVGARGTLDYTVAKPFQTGAPVEAVDSNGKLIGKKQAYGEEYSSIKVPTPIRNRMTSVIAYSATNR